MMTPRRRASAVRLVTIIVVLLLCMWMLYRLFIGIPPAPAPNVTTGRAPAPAYPSHHRCVSSISSLA